ncbi:B12-binding domain-containing radical SAM protein [Chloroflexi bacterium TSY]|nr:B12-binding domain-containing radical SAM protein [Chloroflexi bacterium TSY]
MLILYNPPSNAQRKPVLPMSLLALGALLEEDHSYIIIDGNLEADPLATLDRAIRETGATVLGVTVMPGPQLSDAVPTCRELKRRHAELTVVWGGYFPTQHWEVCLRASYVDYVVRGHGEVVFKELLDTLKRGDDPAALPGIAYRHPQNGEPISNVEAPIPHPDQMPDFPYHRIPMERYIRPTFLGNRTLPHHASYGCPFFCNFCAVVNLVNGRWLAQSAERTANTARQLVTRYGANAIEFYDNNAFTAEARIDTMLKYKDRTWERMRDSGLKMVFLGAELGSNETLQRMNKGGKASTEKTLEIAQKMAHYDIVPEMSFVLGNPPDPEADIRQTINFIRQVKRINPATEIILYMYTPVPLAGELYEQAKAEGFQFPETLEGWISHEWQEFSQRRSITMPWLQDPVRRKIRNFQWVLNAYHPTTTDITMSWQQRTLLRTAATWRYQLGIYQFPLELRALHKVMSYQRPETSGF